MYFHSIVYLYHIGAREVKSALTQYTHTISISCEDVKYFILRGEGRRECEDME